MDKKMQCFLTNCIIAMVIIGIILQFRNYNNASSIESLICIILFYFAVLKIIDAMLRTYHQYTNNKSTKLAVEHNQKFSVGTLIFKTQLMIFITLTIIKHRYIYNYIKEFDAFSCTICILFSWILLTVLDLDEKGKKNVCDINLMQGLDYGSGMAYNYFYGYLRLIVPSTGSLSKGLVEKIENTEDNHNIKIAVHKLFILIPSSSYIPTDLKEASYRCMESAMDLEDEVRNRAGVKRRSYHNSVYKIYPCRPELNSAPVYVVVEGATPILTFFEVQKHAHRETSIYRKYCKDIVQKFYEKLKELIDNDPECADLCELIYYDDYNSDGTKVNVAEVILERVYKIQNMRTMNDTCT